MSWCRNGPVEKHEDYRDQAVTQRILRLAERGVVVVGPSRIGKSSLLQRSIESLGSRFKGARPILLSSKPEEVFASLEQASDWLLLDEAQLLLDWSPEAITELHRRLKERPFILAAWPTLKRPDVPVELQRFLEDVRTEVLKPLGREETARMVRRAANDAPMPCEEDVVEAIFHATSGFPNLVARLCLFLTDEGTETLERPTDEALTGFIDSLTDLDDPFQAIHASLPPRKRQLLDEYRSGQQVSLEALREYGLVSGRPAAFTGSLLVRVWGPGSEWEPRSAPVASPVRPRPSGPKPAVTWIHLSDLHFGAGERQRQQKHRFNQEVVTRAIREDVEKQIPWTPDFIFVTGDIAFSAEPEQYQQASQWLRQLAEAAGTSTSALRLVPGNHDVDRSRASAPLVQSAHEAIRRKPGGIDDYLDEEQSRKQLGDKLN
ncbi:MAG TPA: metallophosphoesterase, partial [Myxococcaceae bacterium]|nr:metallophosphoesterase [Myxococcaceae bacterium]